MPRPKASVTPTVKKPVETKIVLTEKQFKTLQEISEAITDARLSIGRFDVENLAEAGFAMGKVYVHIDKIEDQIADLVNEIDPDCVEGEDY